jgi:carbonic anhydrase
MPYSTVTPDEAVKMLQKGNARYIAGASHHPNLDQFRRSLTAQSQHPFAAFLSCADSRVPVELLCDTGIGDLFVVRNAGNVVGRNELGSIEYSVDRLAVSLFVVMAHSNCGAVKAVYESGLLEGNLRGISERILPAVEQIKNNNSGPIENRLVDEAAKINLWNAIGDAFKSSECIRNRVKSGDIQVMGAFYDIETGEIDWMGAHPEQDKFLHDSMALGGPKSLGSQSCWWSMTDPLYRGTGSGEDQSTLGT